MKSEFDSVGIKDIRTKYIKYNIMFLEEEKQGFSKVWLKVMYVCIYVQALLKGAGEINE